MTQKLSTIRRPIGRLAAAAAGLLLLAGAGGCVWAEDDAVRPSNDKAVRFRASTEPTRAATGHPVESGATLPVGGTFGVYAYGRPSASDPLALHDDFENTPVTHTSTDVYTYSPEQMWPMAPGHKLGFYAYYPYVDQDSPSASDPDITVTASAGSLRMNIHYSVPADASQHVDLMYARSGMREGFDPVPLTFRHALARLNFEARAEGFQSSIDVKITKIEIKGAVSEGDLKLLDDELQPTPWWDLGTQTVDHWTDTNKGLNGNVSLTGTLQDITTPGGDMLVIPQDVSNLEMLVYISLNGEEQAEPFSYSLAGTDEWAMNEIVTYEITVLGNGVYVNSTSESWTTNKSDVVYDGQWWLSVTEDYFNFGVQGGTKTFTAETNYNRSDLGFPVGLQIDELDIEYSDAGGWLTVNISGSSGDFARDLTIETGTTTTLRRAKIFVRAGNLTKVINVKQDVYTLTTDLKSYYSFGQHTITVRSNSLWEIESVDDPDGVLLTPFDMTQSGGENLTTGDPITFEFVRDETKDNAVVTVVLRDPTGMLENTTLRIIYFACGCDGVAFAKAIGTRGYDNSAAYPYSAGKNTYLTYTYAGQCWTVQNSREGSYRRTTYAGKTAGERGYYYGSGYNEPANYPNPNACPAGWRVPTVEDAQSLINAMPSMEAASKVWWTGTAGLTNGAFAGHVYTDGSSYWWDENGVWFTQTNGPVIQGAPGQANVAYTTITWGANSVRCVKD